MQTEILTAPVTVCHNRLIEAAPVFLALTEYPRWRKGLLPEDDGLGVNNKEERARNTAYKRR